MKSYSAFIGANGTVELYAVTPVYFYLPMIIHPWYLKCDDSFRLCDAFQDTVFHIFRMFFKNRNKRTEYFFDSLEEFLLMWISLFYHCKNFIHIFTYPLFIRYFFKIN